MRRHIPTIITVILVIMTAASGGYYYFLKNANSVTKNSTTNPQTTNEIKKTNDNSNKSSPSNTTQEDINSLRGKTPDNISEPTLINGILLANKKHPLPKNYNPGEDPTARANVNRLIAEAQSLGLNISNQVSGFRAYQTQVGLYNNYVAEHGKSEADKFSARPGYSEHQTGLVFDLIDNDGQLLGSTGTSDSSKKAAEWLANNAHKYGFIVRYKPEFTEKTGYIEESWHIRYVGNNVARELFEKNISLEEYLNALGGDYIE